MDEAIYAIDGNVLHIHSTHAGATMSGNLENRFITVVNASLYLENIIVEFGSALVRGAVASSSSSLTLNHTSFVGNHAGGTGSALYGTDQSTVSFVGKSTTCLNNSAYSSGGALHVASSSVVSWKGRKTFFTDNISHRDGGAVTVRSESVASWSAETTLFSNKTFVDDTGAPFVLRIMLLIVLLGMGPLISRTTLLGYRATPSPFSTAPTFHGGQKLDSIRIMPTYSVTDSLGVTGLLFHGVEKHDSMIT